MHCRVARSPCAEACPGGPHSPGAPLWRIRWWLPSRRLWTARCQALRPMYTVWYRHTRAPGGARPQGVRARWAHCLMLQRRCSPGVGAACAALFWVTRHGIKAANRPLAVIFLRFGAGQDSHPFTNAALPGGCISGAVRGPLWCSLGRPSAPMPTSSFPYRT